MRGTGGGTPTPALSRGTILIHEHPLAAAETPQEVVDLLVAFRERGGSLIVDVTPQGCHLPRDIQLLRSIAEKSGVEILFGLGYYKEPHVPGRLYGLSAEEMADELVQEIEEGIGGSGVCPAVIGEVGSSLGKISGLERKLLRAAALAQRRTGLPLITHTTHGTMGLEQLDILEAAGADLEKVVIGHCDLNPELRYQLEIARRGVNLGFDTVGKERWISARSPKELAHQPDEVRVRLISELFARDFGGRIVLSLDMLHRERMLNPDTHGKYGYTYIFVFLEKLQDAGLPHEECERLVTENPRRILGKG